MSLPAALLWSGPIPGVKTTRGRAAAVPRMATAAVRIPDPRTAQLPLHFISGGPQIFVHEGARQALERKLELSVQGPVQLAVTDNLHRMITQTRERGTLRIRVHMMFLDAPERVQDALVDYIVGAGRAASQVIGAFIDKNSHRIRASRRYRGRSLHARQDARSSRNPRPGERHVLRGEPRRSAHHLGSADSSERCSADDDQARFLQRPGAARAHPPLCSIARGSLVTSSSTSSTTSSFTT